MTTDKPVRNGDSWITPLTRFDTNLLILCCILQELIVRHLSACESKLSSRINSSIGITCGIPMKGLEFEKLLITLLV